MPFFFYKILWKLCTRCDETQTFQKVQPLSHLSTEYILANMSLCDLFGQQRFFTLELSPVDAIFAQFDLNWDKSGLQFFRCCSVFICDLLVESSMHSWSNFGRSATPGNLHHCSTFSPFLDYDSHYGSLESKSRRNVFVALSRLIDVKDFASHVFLSYFRWWQDALLFEIRSGSNYAWIFLFPSLNESFQNCIFPFAHLIFISF